MTLQEIVNLIRQDGMSWVVVLFIAMSIVQISPLQIDPWSGLIGWIGAQFTKDINDRITKMENKLDEHISKYNEREIAKIRARILDFGNSCLNGRKHNQEEFNFIIDECDKYKKYCLDNDIENGVAEDTIAEIRRIHKECLRNHSFLGGAAKTNDGKAK